MEINEELRRKIYESTIPGILDLTDRLKNQPEVQEIISWAIRQLSNYEQGLITLRFFFGWPYKHIGWELGKSEAAVRQEMSRIILKIRDILGNKNLKSSFLKI